MTKQHFIALADVLKTLDPRKDAMFLGIDEGEKGMVGQHIMTVGKLADFCQSQNPRFNRERWLAYIDGECGPNGGKL